MLSLVPLDDNSILSSRKQKLNALLLLFNLTNEAINACDDFLAKRWMAFDAQVGDTSCQIRAYKICYLAQNKDFINEVHELRLNLDEYKHGIRAYINAFEDKLSITSKYSNDLDSKDNKNDFFSKITNKLHLSDNHIFIITAHFLYKYCISQDGIPTSIDYNHIKLSLNLGSTAARKLSNHYQSILSKLSCDFVLQQVDNPDKPDMRNSYLFMKNLIRIGDRKRCIMQFYKVTETLLSADIASSLAVIFSIRYEMQNNAGQLLFFKKHPLTNKLVLKTTLSEIDRQLPAVIFRGFINDTWSPLRLLKATILKLNAEKVILWNAARHRQYAGQILNEYAVNNPYAHSISDNRNYTEEVVRNSEPLSYTKVKSRLISYSQNNIKLFNIQHVFCSTFHDEYNMLFSYKDNELWLNQNPQMAQMQIGV